ncbi:MAG TPA: ParB/RepB/Spo0J family partition protein [Stellaceae bacterium]|nr:ParB/RepB/Spo0J family partition protein [Stellaceae bacterium]
MSEPRRGLGRGLSALLGEERTAPHGGARSVPIERLHPSRFQPRRVFDDSSLDALAQSIATQGVLQPLLVRRHPSLPDAYEILAGERRWRAAQRAKLTEVPILLREVGDRDALELALVENVQREDLTALEEAQGYQRLIAEFGYTQEALAQRIGKSRSHVANTIRLLALPDPVKALLEEGKLSAGHARALLGAPDAIALALRAVRDGLNVRQVEQAVHGRLHPGVDPVARGGRLDPNVKALEKELSLLLGLGVFIHVTSAEGGELAIRYRSLEQLDGLIRRLKGQGP